MLMKDTDPEHYNFVLNHLIWMASMPAAKDHAWLRAKELDAEPYGFYKGIKDDLVKFMLAQKENAGKISTDPD
jgi:hypothetical protein